LNGDLGGAEIWAPKKRRGLLGQPAWDLWQTYVGGYVGKYLPPPGAHYPLHHPESQILRLTYDGLPPFGSGDSPLSVTKPMSFPRPHRGLTRARFGTLLRVRRSWSYAGLRHTEGAVRFIAQNALKKTSGAKAKTTA